MWRLNLLIIAAAVCQVHPVASLRMIDIRVPHHSVVGKSVRLECIFDMENDELYSVKWYKGSTEFFRYLPKDKPPAQVYDFDGVNVDITKSDINVVTLNDISLMSSGVYRCEVSADSPTFNTDSLEAEMSVIAIPEGRPIITGGQAKYEDGDNVNVNCTSSKSKPAAMLFWTINEEKAPKETLEKYHPIIDEDGLETSVLGLQFQVNASHFSNGDLRIKCTATIAPIYYQTNEESFVSARLQASVLESKETPVQAHTEAPNQSSSIYGTWWWAAAILELARRLLLG